MILKFAWWVCMANVRSECRSLRCRRALLTLVFVCLPKLGYSDTLFCVNSTKVVNQTHQSNRQEELILYFHPQMLSTYILFYSLKHNCESWVKSVCALGDILSFHCFSNNACVGHPSLSAFLWRHNNTIKCPPHSLLFGLLISCRPHITHSQVPKSLILKIKIGISKYLWEKWSHFGSTWGCP